jgi:hypothetical protein
MRFAGFLLGLQLISLSDQNFIRLPKLIGATSRWYD